MSVFALLSLISFFIAIILGGYVFFKRPNNLKNQLFLILCFSFSLLSFFEFELRTSESYETAFYWYEAMGIWPFTVVIPLHFVIVFTNSLKKFNRKLIYIVLYSMATAIFFIEIFTDLTTKEIIRTDWGWSYILNTGVFNYTLFVWILLITLLTLLLPLRSYIKSTGWADKKKAFYLFIGFSITFVIGIVTDIILPATNIRFPELNNTSIIISFLFITYAVRKYDLFILNPFSLTNKILDTMFSSFIMTDADGKILITNEATQNILGYTADELTGKNIDIILKDLKSNEDILYPQNVSLIECNYYTKDGNAIPVLLARSGISPKSKRSEGLVFIANNISDLKRTEIELISQKKKAQEANRMKSIFLANIAHEIRSPLNAIVGSADLIADYEVSPEIKGYVGTIQNSCNMLLAIIEDVLHLSKIESQELELEVIPVCFPDILTEVEKYGNVTRSRMNKNIKLIKSLPGKIDSHIYCDPFRIQQVLNNLLNNALKFTEEGSIEFGARIKSKEFLEFFVKDTGIGISSREQKRIIEPFQQANPGISRKYGGTGLGITISKRLVELMGGEFRLESKTGKDHGTTVYFTLPYKAVEPDKINLAEEENAMEGVDINENSYKILLAEDDDVNQKVVKIILEKAGYEVEIVNNGREAVSKFENDNSIDLIIIDTYMPAMDGIKATKVIRGIEAEQGRKKKVIIIAFSAVARQKEIDKYVKVGCDDYILKPVNRASLLQKVSKYLN